ncbi:hypothetical protein DM860_003699 [Cuscuta australis]|uniref:Peptidase A1 domain-containing protein n=1 Tax=Cuscuta australis TaxID=267555 RepID=A0A328DIB8_9ASTE|nr:hypothetical protein DM860_003699 [Cuscuta australis]
MTKLALLFLPIVFLLIFLVVQLPSQQYSLYHRHSDEVVGVLGSANLPRSGKAAEYYSVWAAHNHRRLRQAFTFAGGGVTTNIDSLGSLHYARIHVGTPPVPFLVALDTGSELCWLPCRCKNCARSFNFSTTEVMSLNSYEPRSSSTSKVVRCHSSYCFGSSRESCPLLGRAPCTYEYSYISPNTATKGFLVEDLIHLETYDRNATHIVVPVVFGCGEVETGFILDQAAINGFIGLAHGTLDLTSLLSSRGLVPNSFSLCFAPDGSGRIAFGDKGDHDQMINSFVEDSPISVADVPFDYCYIREWVDIH